MCDAYGSAYGETDLWASSSGTSISGSTKMRVSSVDDGARSQLRVRYAAENFEGQILALARRCTVKEFIEIRAKVEDIFDSILLAGRV